MKTFTQLTLVVLFLLAAVGLHAQPNSAFDNKNFSFQGYARNGNGGALASQNIDIRFTIYPQGNEAGAVMTETHTNVATDPFGVFGVLVGSVSTAQFKQIDFGKANYFLKVETKPSASGSFVEISNQALQATPYAKFANNGNPVGTVISWAGSPTNIPAGYLICDGTQYNTSDYPRLAEVLGTNWGGNGSTNFNVPDMRGMFLRGYAGNSNDDPDKGSRIERNGGATGNAVGSYQANEVQSHNHGATAADEGAHRHNYWDTYSLDAAGRTPLLANTSAVSIGSNVYGTGGDTDNNTAYMYSRNSEPGSAHSHVITVNNNGGSESRPKNVYVLYLIKY